MGGGGGGGVALSLPHHCCCCCWLGVGTSPPPCVTSAAPVSLKITSYFPLSSFAATALPLCHASYTNSAVDNILLKLVEEQEQGERQQVPVDLTFLRLGNSHAVHPRIRPYLPGGARWDAVGFNSDGGGGAHKGPSSTSSIAALENGLYIP